MVSQPATEETGTVELATFDDGGNPIAASATPSSESPGALVPSATTAKATPQPIRACSRSKGCRSERMRPCWRPRSKTPDVEQAQQAKPRRSVSVRRGGRPTRTIFNIRAQQRQRGDLLIRVRDQDGSYLAGACFGLIPNGETAPSDRGLRQPRRRREQRRRPHPPHRHPGRPLHADPDRPPPTATPPPRTSRSASRRAPCARWRSPTRPNRSAPRPSTSRRLTARGTALPGRLLRDHARATRRSKPATTRRRRHHPVRRYSLPAATSCARPSRPAGGFTTAGSTATRLDPGQTRDGHRRQRGAPGQPAPAQDRRRGPASGRSLLRAPSAGTAPSTRLRQRRQRRQHQRRRHPAGDGRARNLHPARDPAAGWLSRRRRPGGDHLRQPAEPGQRRRRPRAATAAHRRPARLQARYRWQRAGRLLLCR